MSGRINRNTIKCNPIQNSKFKIKELFPKERTTTRNSCNLYWYYILIFASLQELLKYCTVEEKIIALVDSVGWRLWSGRPLPSLAMGTFTGRYFVGAVNSPKFPVYELDYGWGKPLNAQTGVLYEDGGMMLFPGRGRDDGGRSIEIYTRLPRRQMETLKRILMIIPDFWHDARLFHCVLCIMRFPGVI